MGGGNDHQVSCLNCSAVSSSIRPWFVLCVFFYIGIIELDLGTIFVKFINDFNSRAFPVVVDIPCRLHLNQYFLRLLKRFRILPARSLCIGHASLTIMEASIMEVWKPYSGLSMTIRIWGYRPSQSGTGIKRCKAKGFGLSCFYNFPDVDIHLVTETGQFVY